MLSTHWLAGRQKQHEAQDQQARASKGKPHCAAAECLCASWPRNVPAHAAPSPCSQPQPDNPPMNTTRLTRFSSGCHGLPRPSALLPNWSIMCTPWNTNLQGGSSPANSARLGSINQSKSINQLHLESTEPAGS